MELPDDDLGGFLDALALKQAKRETDQEVQLDKSLIESLGFLLESIKGGEFDDEDYATLQRGCISLPMEFLLLSGFFNGIALRIGSTDLYVEPLGSAVCLMAGGHFIASKRGWQTYMLSRPGSFLSSREDYLISSWFKLWQGPKDTDPKLRVPTTVAEWWVVNSMKVYTDGLHEFVTAGPDVSLELERLEFERAMRKRSGKLA